MKQGAKQDESFFKDLYQKYSKQIEEKVYALMKHTEYDQSSITDEAIQFLLESSIKNKQEIKELQQEMIDISQLFKKSIWKSSFTTNFLNQFSQRGYKYTTILTYLNLIVDGYFHHTYPITKTEYLQLPYQMPFQSFFIHTIKQMKCQIFFCVSVFNKMKSNVIKFNHTIVFLDVRFGENNSGDFQKQAFSFLNTSQNDLSKTLNGYDIRINSQLVVQSHQKTIVGEKFLFIYDSNTRWANLQFQNDMNNKYCRWIPTQFVDIGSYEKDFGWYQLSRKHREQLNLKISSVNQIIKENKAILNQYANFKDSGVILDLIRNCQQLNQNKEQQQILKITDQEREIIGIPQNSLVIGRSGTGKTTCSLLRIYSATFLMNIRQRLFGQKKQEQLVNPFDNQQKVNLRFLFTTLNQVLISEVRGYYRNLKATIKQQLTSKENRGFALDESFASLSSIAHQDIDESFYIDTISIFMEQPDPQQKSEKVYEELEQMNQLANEDFPAFVAIQKLLFLIDSTLEKSFFAQEKYQNLKQKKNRAGWNQAKVIRIGQDFKDIYDVQQDGFDEYIDEESIYKEPNIFEDENNVEKESQIQLNYCFQSLNKNLKNYQYQEKNEQESAKKREIVLAMLDFDYFLNHFWPLIKKKCEKQLEKVDSIALPQLIWTQIFSVIKGSQYSYLYPQQCLPYDHYQEKYQNKLSKEQLKTVYEAFLEYEKWKNENDSFDLLDLVNYLLVQIKDGKYNGVPIHYLLVDEIQDLPHAMIELLTCITEQGLFFCGDTAQTIMKGIGFRFQDIKQLFRNQVISGNTKFADVKQLQLSVNFRSHNSILQMANCLVSLIELFFPKQIDHLNQEISNIKGPKPYVVMSKDIELIIKLLKKILAVNQSVKEKIGFGCNQVIIVQDEETKEKVNSKLAHALILTIYEAKGLEFEDVILYNFFSNGISYNQWNLLKYVILEDYELTAGEQVQRISTHNVDGNQKIDDIKSLYKTKKLRLNPQIQTIDLTQYQNLCNELKLIYVGVTRAKRSLIIYDEDPSKRQHLQELWKQLDIVELVDNESISKISQLDMIDERAYQNKDGWKKMGIKMFINKYYDQAVKCFENCEDDFLIHKARAYAAVTNATKYQSKYIQLINESKETRISKHEKQQLKIQTQENEQLSKQQYKQAGDNFVQIKSYRNAADCYFSSEEYKIAFQYYLISNSIIEAAECCIKLKKEKKGAILYFLAEQYEQSLEFLSREPKHHCLIIEILSQYSNQIDSSSLVQRHLINHFKPTLQTYYSAFIKQNNQGGERQKDKNQEILDCLTYFNQKIGKIYKFVNKSNQFKLNQFSECILQTIYNNINQVKDKDSFMNLLHNQITQLQDPLLDILDKKFINYNRQKYKNTFESGILIDNQQTIKIHFFEDIFLYFELYKLVLFLYSFYEIKETEKYYKYLVYQWSTIFKHNLYSKQLNPEINREEILEKHFDLLAGIQISKQLDFYQCQIQLGYWFVTLKLNEQNQQDFKVQSNFIELASLFKDYPNIIRFYSNFNHYNNNLYIEMTLLEQYFFYQKKKGTFFAYFFKFKSLLLIQQFIKCKDNKAKDSIIVERLKQTQYKKHLDDQKMDEDYYQISICLILTIQTINQQFINQKHSKTYESLFCLGEERETENKQIFYENLIIFFEIGSQLFKHQIYRNQQISIFKAFCTIWHLSFPVETILNFLGSTYIFVHQLSPILEMIDQESLKKGFIISSEHDIKLFPSQIIIEQIRKYCKKIRKRFQNDYMNNMQIQDDGYPRYSIKIYRSLNKEVADFYSQRFYKRAVLKDLKQYFFVGPHTQKESASIKFNELSTIYLKKMSEDTQKLKFCKHFINSCLIMKLLHNQESNYLMLDILYDQVNTLPVSQKCLEAFFSYIVFQDYFSKCFSIKGAQQYMNYYEISKNANIYQFVTSDLIGVTLCLIFNFHYQQYYKQGGKNKQKYFQDDLNHQGQEVDEVIVEETNENQQDSNYKDTFEKKIWITKELKQFCVSQDQQIVVCNEIYDINYLTMQICQILVDHLIQIQNTNSEILLLLQFILISIDINYAELENYIEQKLQLAQVGIYKWQYIKILQILQLSFDYRIKHDDGDISDYANNFDEVFIEFQIYDSDSLIQYYTHIKKISKKADKQTFRDRVQISIQAIEYLKFQNLYYAMRYLFQKSMINRLSKREDKDYQKDYLLSELYEKIDQHRMKFYEILYESKNFITFQSITYQLSKLKEIELQLDKMLQNYDRKMIDKVHQQLDELNNSIQEWESKNSNLKEKFKEMDEQYLTNFKRQIIFKG